MVIQAQDFLGEEVDRDRVRFSIEKYGIFTVDRISSAYKRTTKKEERLESRRTKKLRYRVEQRDVQEKQEDNEQQEDKEQEDEDEDEEQEEDEEPEIHGCRYM